MFLLAFLVTIIGKLTPRTSNRLILLKTPLTAIHNSRAKHARRTKMKRTLEEADVLEELPSEVWSLIFSIIDDCDARLWLSLLSLTSSKSLPRGWFGAITSMTKLAFLPNYDKVCYYNTEKILVLMKKFPLLSSIKVVCHAFNENSFLNEPVGSLDRIKELCLIGPRQVIVNWVRKFVLFDHLPNLESLDIGTFPIVLIPELLTYINESLIHRITTLRAFALKQMEIDKFVNLQTLELELNLVTESLILDNLKFLRKVSINGPSRYNVIPDFKEKRSIEISMKNRERTIRGNFSVLGGKITGEGSMELHLSKRIFTGEWKDGLHCGIFTMTERGETKEIGSLDSELLKLLSMVNK